jgi:hypothetical protein
MAKTIAACGLLPTSYGEGLCTADFLGAGLTGHGSMYVIALATEPPNEIHLEYKETSGVGNRGQHI